MMCLAWCVVFFTSFFGAWTHAQNPPTKSTPMPSVNAGPTQKIVPSRNMKPLQPTANPVQPYVAPGLTGLGANVLSDSARRDPFRLPQYLIDRLTVRAPSPLVTLEPQAIDDRVEPIRRWGTTEYTLVGIIWEVKNPKALLRDIQSRVHVIRINDKVGNQNGAVTSIREGAITVTEKDAPIVLRLKK